MNILELHLLTDDISETEKFYNGLLGLQIIHKDSSSVSFSAGLSTLIFNQSDNLKPFYHFAFNIPKNKLNKAFEWTSARVEILDTAPGRKIANFDAWNAKSFYFREKLITDHSLTFFSKQPRGDHFAVIGDDNGLLILVNIGRIWFPHHRLAEKHWTKIKVSSNGKTAEIEIGGQ